MDLIVYKAKGRGSTHLDSKLLLWQLSLIAKGVCLSGKVIAGWVWRVRLGEQGESLSEPPLQGSPTV